MVISKKQRIANNIRKWEFVEKVRTPENMPPYFGFKDLGHFEGYDLIIISEIDSQDFIRVHGSKLRKMKVKYGLISYYTIGVNLK